MIEALNSQKRIQFLRRWKESAEAYPALKSAHQFKGQVSNWIHHSVTCSVQIPSEWQGILAASDWISAKIENGICVELVFLAPDLNWQENAKQVQVANIKNRFERHTQWMAYLSFVRHWLIDQQIQEVQTPTLVTCPGTEPHLDPFFTELSTGARGDIRKMTLPTSPELHLKKTIAATGKSVFEIRPCFRNGEVGPNHQPEFTMLEYYLSFVDLQGLMKSVESLVIASCDKLKVARPRVIRQVSVAELFREHLGFELTPRTSQKELFELAIKHKMVDSSAQNWHWDDLFFILFLEKIEKRFDFDTLYFVYDYPPSQAALARINSRGFGDRFEFYWHGLELGNAFCELNDPRMQRQRMLEDIEYKRKLGKALVSCDEEFLVALESGMPPCSGVAIGLERLFMCLANIENIADFRLFPVEPR